MYVTKMYLIKTEPNTNVGEFIDQGLWDRVRQ